MQLEIPLESVQKVLEIAKDKIIILDPAPADNKIMEFDLSNVFLMKPNESELKTLTNANISDEESIVNACKIYKVQLIATTHSLEVIDAFIQTSKNIDKLTCFRLEHYNENIYSNRLAGQKLKDVRCILGQDVR